MKLDAIVFPDIGEVEKDGEIFMDFLLPNGCFVQLSVDFYTPLEIIKEKVWKEAQKFPLYSKLQRHDVYKFVILNQDCQMEEVLDESLRLCDIRPVGTFLKVIEKKTEKKHETLDKKISTLIGRGAVDANVVSRAEVDDFRKRMQQFGLSKLNTKKDWYEIFRIRHPPRLRSSTSIPKYIEEACTNGYFVYNLKVEDFGGGKSFMQKVHIEDEPSAIIDMAIEKMKNNLGIDNINPADCILKCMTMEDYIYGNHVLHRFKYIYECLQRRMAPEFCLKDKRNVFTFDPIRNHLSPTSSSSTLNRQTIMPKRRDTLTWDIKDKFNFVVDAVTNIENMSDQGKNSLDKLNLIVGLYHGNELLGEVLRTKDYPVKDGKCKMGESLIFDLNLEDVQFTSKICFTLNGRAKKTKSFEAVAWGNIPVFDFRSRLQQGEQYLQMWPVTADLQFEESGLYSIGTVAVNPHSVITLVLNFPDYGRKPPIIFPPEEIVIQCAADNMEKLGHPGSPQWKASKTHIDQLKTILERTSDSLHMQDKDLTWLLRYECLENMPHALPLVLNSVKWYNHIDVAKMQVLLSAWRPLPVDQALELLDFNFPDKYVRKYAVDCLSVISDEELSLYILQLVQALKYETHLYCPLAEFLMERALKNQHIGHQLFWLLKSEIHDPKVTVRYGLLLESYLKLNPEHMNLLIKQHDALSKMYTVSMLMQSEKYKNIQNVKNREMAIKDMRSVLEQKAYRDKLSDIQCPLSPLYRLKDLAVEDCKFMDSKKRPLWLVWKNADWEGQKVQTMYKNGDDLRQDMLTLQILQVMDSIWQSEGLDLRMNIYGCVATGLEQGMIEIVQQARTLADIQKIQTNSALDKRSLHLWLKEKNGEENMDHVVKEFMLSCAGYTVATYVLGIGDRHNDNIMLKENGQLFHIDFGHFLGNFKSYKGIKRERVPFVFTSHFEYVITNADSKHENLKEFHDYCEKAYKALRKKGPLLIRLFMMMLSSGIPQLTSVSDLDYLKETLALNMSEEKAIQQFRAKFDEARNAFSPYLNWALHNFVHK
ncbi:hypothetical protein CHS0354_006178 [Potamilus streckersoni]|uniref:phosphatidylinositol 3-kinase n=1 Tax=Potamilus streckersoni TaxID=2493646 RepID=A0AAE0WBK8_9BIVA|nr:hypothetical protein CHS0354_006178 [Potamilus streckersoni]